MASLFASSLWRSRWWWSSSELVSPQPITNIFSCNFFWKIVSSIIDRCLLCAFLSKVGTFITVVMLSLVLESPGRAEISFSASRCNEWVVYDQRVQHEAAKLSLAEGCREGHKKTVVTLADKSVYYCDGAENWDELLRLFLQKKGLSKTVSCTQLRIVVDVVSVSLWFAS